MSARGWHGYDVAAHTVVHIQAAIAALGNGYAGSPIGRIRLVWADPDLAALDGHLNRTLSYGVRYNAQKRASAANVFTHQSVAISSNSKFCLTSIGSGGLVSRGLSLWHGMLLMAALAQHQAILPVVMAHAFDADGRAALWRSRLHSFRHALITPKRSSQKVLPKVSLGRKKLTIAVTSCIFIPECVLFVHAHEF